MSQFRDNDHKAVSYWDGNTLRDSDTHKEVGSRDGNRIFDADGKYVAYQDGNKLFSADHKLISESDGNRVWNADGKSIGYMDKEPEWLTRYNDPMAGIRAIIGDGQYIRSYRPPQGRNYMLDYKYINADVKSTSTNPKVQALEHEIQRMERGLAEDRRVKDEMLRDFERHIQSGSGMDIMAGQMAIGETKRIHERGFKEAEQRISTKRQQLEKLKEQTDPAYRQKRLKERYDAAVSRMYANPDTEPSEWELKSLSEEFQALGDYKDSYDLARACFEKYKNKGAQRLESVYSEAMGKLSQLNSGVRVKNAGEMRQKAQGYDSIASTFESISGYKDADDKAKMCRESVTHFNKRADDLITKARNFRSIMMTLGLIPQLLISVAYGYILFGTEVIRHHTETQPNSFEGVLALYIPFIMVTLAIAIIDVLFRYTKGTGLIFAVGAVHSVALCFWMADGLVAWVITLIILYIGSIIAAIPSFIVSGVFKNKQHTVKSMVGSLGVIAAVIAVAVFAVSSLEIVSSAWADIQGAFGLGGGVAATVSQTAPEIHNRNEPDTKVPTLCSHSRFS